MKRLVIILGSLLLVVAAGVATMTILKSTDTRDSAIRDEPEAGTPQLQATRLIEGLNHPWDIDFLPDGTLMFTERSGDISVLKDGTKTVLEASNDVQVGGEGGLMGLAVDPDFGQNRFIYTCFNSTQGDIRVARWVVNETEESLRDRTDIVTGMPSADSGRHSGCQLAFAPDGTLWIGTGDTADETQPQDTAKLGGKILRVTRDGVAAPGNPPASKDKRVYSYGHRNVQALAFYPALRNDSFGLSVEHGPDRDDEVNELKPGNFGWAPSEGYDESVPMTDTTRFPDATESVWSSGESTIAPSGAAFLQNSRWGQFESWLAVSVLKDQKLLLLNIADGSVSGEKTFFEGEYGRLRAATLGPDGALYVSTDNGENDAIIKITTL